MRAHDIVSSLKMLFENGAPVMLVGPPGCGKTDCVIQAADEIGLDYIISHPIISDPTDYKGLPSVVNGFAEFLPYGQLRQMIETTTPLLVFFDDLGQAPEAVQAALMQLLLAREIDGQVISDHVTFCAATNDHSHGAAVNGIIEPLKSRFATIINFDVTLDDWTDWAFKNDVDEELIAFVNFEPEVLNGFKPAKDMSNSPTPRTIANVDKLIKMGFKPDSLVAREAFKGAAGEAFAIDFCNFVEMAKELPDPDEALRDPHSVKLPEHDKISILFALIIAVANRVTKKTSPQFRDLLFRIMDEYGNEYGQIGLKFLTTRVPEAKPKWPIFTELFVRLNNEMT